MSDDLTARLREVLPAALGADAATVSVIRWDEAAACVAEVADGWHEEKVAQLLAHNIEAERERDEARRAAEDMSAKLDARINVGADLDEAVRLLERVWPDIDPMRPTSEEVRAFLARHKEAQAPKLDPDDHPSGCLCDLHVDHTGNSTHHKEAQG